MFRALRGRLRLILDGGRRRVREETPPQSRPSAQVRARRRARAAPATVRAPRHTSDRPTNRLSLAFYDIHNITN